MSSKAKWLTAAITVVLWVAWLSAFAASKAYPDIAVAHVVATAALQMAAGLCSLILALGWMVSPALAVARTWREIGIREQQRQCETCSHSAERAARLSHFIPSTFTGNVTPIRNVVRNRDNWSACQVRCT